MTSPLRRAVLRACIAVSAVLAVMTGLVGPAAAADPRLEKAREQTKTAQARLDQLAEDIEAVRSEVEEAETELARLEEEAQEQRSAAAAADQLRTERVRSSYISGGTDPVLQLLTAPDADRVLEQARLMAWVSLESRRDMETASAAATRTEALADLRAAASERLKQRSAELDDKLSAAEDAFADAQRAEAEVKEIVAEEKAEARRRAAAAAAAAASRSSAEASAQPTGSGSTTSADVTSAPASGGVACPVAGSRSYVDSWGAPRSGGRSHKGTDILSPHGTPIAAYESGVITRTSSNSLGGISLYLRGSSGNEYYYTHLSGYAVSSGQSVSAGQIIAYNGASGNARGIPHLHFEVRPGGGGSVNPYPYVRRACG